MNNEQILMAVLSLAASGLIAFCVFINKKVTENALNISKLEEKWEFFWKIYGNYLISIVKNPEKLDALLIKWNKGELESRQDIEDLIRELTQYKNTLASDVNKKAASQALLDMIKSGYKITEYRIIDD